MRKMIFLVLMLPFFALIGCSGGGGSDSTADGGIPGGGIPGGGGSGTTANLGNINIPVYPNAANALVNQGGAVVNAARIVVTHSEVVGTQCVEFFTINTACPYDEETETYETGQPLSECNDPLKVAAPDPDTDAPLGCEIIVNQEPIVPNPGAYEDVYGDVKVAVSDTYIPPAGGFATAYVSPGDDYTLKMVAYTSGEVSGDTFSAVAPLHLAPTAEGFLPNTSISAQNYMSGKTNLVRGYWESVGPFSIVSNDDNVIVISEVTPIAALTIPNPAGTPATSGDSYQVSATMSAGVKNDIWYLQTNTVETDSGDMWLIRSGASGVQSSSGGPIEVDTLIIPENDPCVEPSDPQCSIWHHAQFFINPDLLADVGEPYNRWTYGVTVEGELEAWWGADFEICGDGTCAAPDETVDNCPIDCP